MNVSGLFKINYALTNKVKFWRAASEKTSYNLVNNGKILGLVKRKITIQLLIMKAAYCSACYLQNNIFGFEKRWVTAKLSMMTFAYRSACSLFYSLGIQCACPLLEEKLRNLLIFCWSFNLSCPRLFTSNCTQGREHFSGGVRWTFTKWSQKEAHRKFRLYKKVTCCAFGKKDMLLIIHTVCSI